MRMGTNVRCKLQKQHPDPGWGQGGQGRLPGGGDTSAETQGNSRKEQGEEVRTEQTEGTGCPRSGEELGHGNRQMLHKPGSQGRCELRQERQVEPRRQGCLHPGESGQPLKVLSRERQGQASLCFLPTHLCLCLATAQPPGPGACLAAFDQRPGCSSLDMALSPQRGV